MNEANFVEIGHLTNEENYRNMQHTQNKIEWDTLSCKEKSNENPQEKM